jgi:hypothetical protein
MEGQDKNDEDAATKGITASGGSFCAGPPWRTYECATCNRVYKTKGAHTRHTQTKKCTRKGKEQCDQCGIYLARRGLTTHKRISCMGAARDSYAVQLTWKLERLKRELRKASFKVRKLERQAREREALLDQLRSRTEDNALDTEPELGFTEKLDWALELCRVAPREIRALDEVPPILE